MIQSVSQCLLLRFVSLFWLNPVVELLASLSGSWWCFTGSWLIQYLYLLLSVTFGLLFWSIIYLLLESVWWVSDLFLMADKNCNALGIKMNGKNFSLWNFHFRFFLEVKDIGDTLMARFQHQNFMKSLRNIKNGIKLMPRLFQWFWKLNPKVFLLPWRCLNIYNVCISNLIRLENIKLEWIFSITSKEIRLRIPRRVPCFCGLIMSWYALETPPKIAVL